MIRYMENKNLDRYLATKTHELYLTGSRAEASDRRALRFSGVESFRQHVRRLRGGAETREARCREAVMWWGAPPGGGEAAGAEARFDSAIDSNMYRITHIYM